ncbi:MAG TPA: type VI secretion system-associated FHA domain protein [Planctomycetota bacterium]
MRLRLEIANVDAEGQAPRSEEFDVDAANPLTFGRTEQNRLQIRDGNRMVSSRHGHIESRADGCYVVDLGSLNGTTLDGVPVKGETGALLSDGCTIQAGPFRLRVELDAGVGSAPAADQQDVEATMFSFDPESVATTAWDAVCRRMAAERRLTAAERRRTLIDELRRHVRKLTPPQARSVLKRVLARAGASEVESKESGDEALLQACCTEMQRLAQALVGGKALADGKDVARFAQLVQGFFELTLLWVVQCMRARHEFEGQFGAEVTLVFERSNNPLKVLEPEELGKTLLDWSGDRDAKAVRDQLEGIYRDLTQHQLGLLVGVKEAIAAVMERLSPEVIETLAQKDAGWLTSKGAKAWEVYRQIYRDFLEEKSKLFHEVISPAIRRGYLGSHQDADGKPS